MKGYIISGQYFGITSLAQCNSIGKDSTVINSNLTSIRFNKLMHNTKILEALQKLVSVQINSEIFSKLDLIIEKLYIEKIIEKI